MKNKLRKNKMIMIGLCSVLLLMIVGYAAFSTSLKISGTSKITSTWDVEITNIESKNIVGNASNLSEPSHDKLSATFSTKLEVPGDSITYDITVANKGNIDATLKKITISNSNNEVIKFETSGLIEGGTLTQGNSAVLSVKVTYDSSVTSQPKDLNSTFKVDLEFEQNSGEVTPIEGMTPSDLESLVVTSGDGLYADTYEAGRYVYRGANPNNYITLGSDTYRIISKEADGTLKVIKNGSIGSEVFDTSNARSSTTDTDYCTSQYGCKVWGSKTTMLNSSGNNVTTMPREIDGTEYNLPDKEASLNTYLNNDWYNSLDSGVQNKIVTHMFNVGLVSDGETDLATILSTESAYKWYGRVGLMNVSDYIKANTDDDTCGCVYLNNSNSDTCITTNWIFNSLGSTYPWTITPFSNSSASGVFNVNDEGGLFDINASRSTGAAPVLYLSSDITLSGIGTSSDPYVVS